MRFYIAGAISRYKGRYEEIEKQFALIEDILVSHGFEVSNPWKVAPYDPGKTWLDYMRKCIPALMECDSVIARRDWFLSRGARIEVILALFLGLPVYSERSIYRLRGLQ